jgi:hypothetical protein
MANCDDINSQLAEIDAQLAELDRIEAAATARMENRARPGTGKTQAALRTLNGETIQASREYFEKTADQMLIDKGDGIYEQLMRSGIDGQEGPRGDSGKMINYRQTYTLDYDQLAPSDQNAGQVLELLGIQRRATPEGQKLMVKFTEERAIQALQAVSRLGPVPVSELAGEFSKKFKAIKDLPKNVVRLAQARWDSASQFANVLEAAADELEALKAVSPETRARLGAAATWASYFENLDAVVRRKIGQSMRSMRFDVANKGEMLIDFNDEWSQLTLSEIKGDTLLKQVLEDVEKGDPLRLKRLAAAARTAPMSQLSINANGFMAQLSLLNNFRRANMLTSVKSWLGRNPASGILVGIWHGAEDVVAGSFRVGAYDGMKAAAFASRAAVDATTMATRNALTFLGSGKATVGNSIENTFETAAALLEKEAQFVDDALLKGLEVLTNPLQHPNIATHGVALMNVLNASFSKVLGKFLFPAAGNGLEQAMKVFGKEVNPQLKDFFDNGGYMPAFRLLGAGDEAVRTMAFAWKTNHEAFIREVENAAKGTPGAQIARRADEAASKALYSGFMSDEELRQFRFAKGITADGNIDDETLRLIAFNELHGMPRVTNDVDDLGTMGVQRSADITFTQTIKDPLIQGIGTARQNALVAWQLPFFKTPMNSLLWTMDRSLVGAALKLQKLDPSAVTPAKLAQTRAEIVVSTAFFTLAGVAIANGTFESGGPRDKYEWALWRRNHTPYSWNLGFMKIEAARFRTGGIDPMDLLGLYADLWQLVAVDGISKGKYDEALQGLVVAFSRMLENKSSLKSVTTMLTAFTEPDRSDIADVIAATAGGLGPLSGLAGNIAEMGRDPAMGRAKRRALSGDELKAIEADPLYAAVHPILNLIQDASERIARQYPGLNQIVKQPEDYDWIGWKVTRPFGIPAEALIPYMPVVLPNDPLAKWLEETGFTTKPNADGKLRVPSANEGGQALEMTMLPDEERKYRASMRELVGQADVEAVTGKRADWDITSYVNGNNLMGALRALKNDPRYQQLLAADPESPDRRRNPGMTAKGRAGTELYRPVQDIIDYYDKRAQIDLATGTDEVSRGFMQRYQGLVRVQTQRMQERYNALSPLMLGR